MRLQLAFWNSSPQLNQDFVRSLEVFYWRIPLVSNSPEKMLWDDDINRLLATAAARVELEWLCILKVGTIFADQDRIADTVREAIMDSKPTGWAMGGEFAYIINLKYFRKYGCPSFDKIPMGELPEVLLSELLYACPEDGLDRLNRNLAAIYGIQDMENISQKRLLGFLANKRLGFNPISKGSGVGLCERDYGVFLFNTEDLLADSKWKSADSRPLDYYMGPCAGFLDAASLLRHGFHEGTRLIYYDINPRALEVRRRLLTSFDGHLSQLLPFLEEMVASYPDDKPFIFADRYAKLEELRQVFGSDEAFLMTWKRLTRLPVEFHKVNMITGFAKLLQNVNPEQNGFLAVSDIFTGQNELAYGHSQISAHFQSLLKTAASKNLTVSGKNLAGRPFIGKAAEFI